MISAPLTFYRTQKIGNFRALSHTGNVINRFIHRYQKYSDLQLVVLMRLDNRVAAMTINAILPLEKARRHA